MGRKKGDRGTKVDRFSSLNAMIAQFLDEMAKDFATASDPYSSNSPIIYGFNVPPGQVTTQNTNNPLKDENGVLATEEEPLIDIIDKDRELTIIAELHGVRKKDIRVTACNDSLTIEAEDRGVNYTRHIPMASQIRTSPKSARYTNGVLELTFDKLNKPVQSNRCAVVKIGDR